MKHKRKPEGSAWDEFVDAWYAQDHSGKVALAESFGVTYDTARHWVSDAGVTRKHVKSPPKMVVTVPELLEMRPSVHLDFVCFDLETSNFEADFSVILCATIKPYGLPPIVFRADHYPEWETNRADDYRITRAIAEELRKHAIVVSHYGQGFDIPFLRAKMVKHGLDPLPQMFGVDSWRIAQKNFKVSSRRLKNLAQYFDIGEKDTVEGRLWMEAAYNGSREAMDRVVEHNIKDVEILEKLACISFPYLKSIPKL
jgi:uncharacterized protein YprB with RNaseH-like and TPR domain